jgi:hypothetical protein
MTNAIFLARKLEMETDIDLDSVEEKLKHGEDPKLDIVFRASPPARAAKWPAIRTH